ncbi:MAG TPA: bifunctional phosphopantothenoylcysteine decarboxylase/phosphopantothenate--cysteine ligase CoaBC [Methylomirabilota bacterium]|nr:bifunctional phosphopantothenoylcysteine decarboxylase/phosphopantothenate--cysteine ligase CoaBC [Methylomirabilota bacterium]
MSLAGRELILGVTGSIAAYKAVYLLRELVKLGAGVTVVLTEHARHFVGPLTFRTLSRRQVLTDLFDPETDAPVEHVSLAERADLFVIAPATANLLAKAAHGVADDLLTTMLLAARGPVLVVPAMDGEMWNHPAVQANVATLRSRKVVILEPEWGELASGQVGKGRFPELPVILDAIHRCLAPRDLEGERVLITAGPTREPIDPVRYLSNRSSGKMGYALAGAALRRGATVVLISGPTALMPPLGVTSVSVQTAQEMRDAVLQHLPESTIVVKAAAVADYRPKRQQPSKIRSRQDDLTIELMPNPDILKEIAHQRGKVFLAGFAAEVEDVKSNALAKLKAKGIDLMIANDVSQAGIGFEADENQVLLLDRWGGVVELPRMEKTRVADAIFDRILTLKNSAPAGVSG